MAIKIGLCGFTIGAAAYFETFPVVEVQQTFYDPPAPLTLERWRHQAPPDFEFTIKAWQVITHRGSSRTYRRLKSPFSEKDRELAGAFRVNDTTLRAWDATLRCARLLRATMVLFQCPSSFRPEPENIENMHAFFTRIERPQGVRFLWEPRGEWPDATVLTICRDLGLLHAVDPFIRQSLTPELAYWRLHGNGSHYASYTEDELQKLKGWLQPQTYAMFNNIPRVGDSKRFAAMIR